MSRALVIIPIQHQNDNNGILITLVIGAIWAV